MGLMRRLALLAAHIAVTAAYSTFSAGISQGVLDASEQVLLEHVVVNTSGLGATLTYFWITGDAPVAEALVRVYVDGEAAPSLTFEPAKAVGIGFLNTSHAPASDLPPWGTRWVGSLGRNAYHTTLRAPFSASLRVTLQAGTAGGCALWAQARGAEGLALDHIIEGMTLPPSARLRLQVRERVPYAPLEPMVVADVPKGTSGAVFLTTVWWDSASPNTIEGCWRAYTPRDAPWPGMVLSTGWEDYYGASWGFIAGSFTTQLSGNTHWTTPENLRVSTYRFHDLDPLFFNDGLLLVQRNGETVDAEGYKCRLESGGAPKGNPGNTTFSAYAWYYTW